MTNFTSLLYQGITSELAVIDTINDYCDSLFDWMHYGSVTAYLPSHVDSPYDILLEIGNDTRSIEVKSANCGDKWPTFFAEIMQTASQGYAEYLVHVPNYIVYVDLVENMHYWYNGDMFAAAVKARYMMRKPASVNAEGVRFLKESDTFGFIKKIKQIPTMQDIVDKYGDKIYKRMTQKGNPRIHKHAPFLPNIE